MDRNRVLLALPAVFAVDVDVSQDLVDGKAGGDVAGEALAVKDAVVILEVDAVGALDIPEDFRDGLVREDDLALGPVGDGSIGSLEADLAAFTGNDGAVAGGEVRLTGRRGQCDGAFQQGDADIGLIGTAETLGAWFERASTKASSNYGIDKDGRIGLYVDEANRSWCTSSSANDNRAITIECASDTYDPYRMNDAVYESLINLCEDICRRNGKNTLLWIDDKDKALAYEPKSNEMLITVHRWFAQKACPGDWLY